MALLEVKDVHTFYGNIEALKGISIEVEEGECVTLIGSNGAGKSTTLRSISGLTPPRQGSIRFQDREITETPPQEIVSMGVAHSPEGRHVFSRMTVHENLMLGAYLRRDDSGIQEDLEAFVQRLQRRFGWELGPPVRGNVTTPSEVSDSFRSRIAEDNQLDMQLYEYALKLLRRRS